MDLNDPKNLEKFTASGSKKTYADWAKEQVPEQQQDFKVGTTQEEIAQTNANFNYETPKIDNLNTAQNVVNPTVQAAVVPQAETPKLTQTQISQLDNLGNIRTSLTGTDINNLKTAVNKGYNIPENIKNLLIKQGLSKDFNIGLPDSGKVDITLEDTTTPIDATKINAATIKPEDLLKTGETKPTTLERPQTIDSMLTSGQKSLDDLYKKNEEMAAKLKATEEAENERLAKGLESAGTTNLEQVTKDYYDKYNVDSSYQAGRKILEQIANARAMYAGTTGTGALTREGVAKISQLQSEYALLNGDFTQAKEMANTYIGAVKDDLNNKIDTYKTLLSRSDSKLVTLTKDQKDIVNNRIALYEEAVKKEDEKKAELDKTISENSGYTMQRAREKYGLDITKDDAQTIKDKVAKAKSDQSFVDALAAKYYDAGINATDTLQSATDKMKSSKSYRSELVKGAGTDSSVISRAMTLLNNGTAKDIYEALDMANTQIADEESTRTISEKEAANNVKPATADEKKAASYSSAMENAINDLDKLGGYVPNYAEQQLINGLEDGKNSWTDTVSNKILSSTAQQFIQAKANFINALLRRQSGAAISASEYSGANTQYFPQSGDKKGNLDQKAANRQAAIDQLKLEAGNAITNTPDTNQQQIKITNDLKDAGYSDADIQEYLKTSGFKTEGSDSQNAVSTSASSFNTNGYQCGEFVNKTAGITVGNTWDNKKANVEKYGNKGSDGLAVGDIIYQDTGTAYGHVAVVTGKDANGNAIVSESNWNNDEKVTHDRVVSPDNIYGYIRPQEAKKLALANYKYS